MALNDGLNQHIPRHLLGIGSGWTELGRHENGQKEVQGTLDPGWRHFTTRGFWNLASGRRLAGIPDAESSLATKLDGRPFGTFVDMDATDSPAPGRLPPAVAFARRGLESIEGMPT